MVLFVFLVFCALPNSGDFFEIKFEALTPKLLMIEFPQEELKKLVTFRVRKEGKANELDLKNSLTKDNLVLFSARELNLAKNDVLKYMYGFTNETGYDVGTGSYVFDGVYTKYKQRAKRQIEEVSVDSIVEDGTNFTVPDNDTAYSGNVNENDTAYSGNITRPMFESRFGYGGGFHHHHDYHYNGCNNGWCNWKNNNEWNNYRPKNNYYNRRTYPITTSRPYYYQVTTGRRDIGCCPCPTKKNKGRPYIDQRFWD